MFEEKETKEILQRGTRDHRGESHDDGINGQSIAAKAGGCPFPRRPRRRRRGHENSVDQPMANEEYQRMLDGDEQLDEKMEDRRMILVEFVPMVRTLQIDVLRRFELIDQLDQDGVGVRGRMRSLRASLVAKFSSSIRLIWCRLVERTCRSRRLRFSSLDPDDVITSVTFGSVVARNSPGREDHLRRERECCQSVEKRNERDSDVQYRRAFSSSARGHRMEISANSSGGDSKT